MKKHFTKTVLLAFCLFLSFSAKAETFVSGNISYSIISETELTVSVIKSLNTTYFGAINIPSSVNYNNKDYTVTAIGESAFEYCYGMTSITIPNSVTTIGESAFYACSGLTSIAIPNSVTMIGNIAFWGCSSMISITIPNSVTTISSSAFIRCGDLTKFIVSKDNASYCDIDGVLFTKDKTVLCAYPNSKGSEYSIPNSVTTIGDGAFSDCSSLTSITIPNSVTTIGNSAFYACRGLTSITIPNSVTTIVEFAFAACSGLTSITIGNSITTIGERAFSSCSGLTSITIPNRVIKIGGGAFKSCRGLTSITIPNSVTTIGEGAFDGCNSLTKFIVSKDNASYCDIDGVLFTKDKTELLAYPNSKGSEYSIPNSVITIGERAFRECGSLTSIYIPNSVTTIGGRAFDTCSNLTSITIGNSVATIGESAFVDCSSLTSITIPNSVTTIGDWAFGNCIGMTSITIGNSVTTIGEEAFSYCSALTTVNSLNPIAPTMGSAAFESELYADATLNIPKGALSSYREAEGWKQFVKINEEFSGVEGIISDAVKVVANGGDINVIGAEENTPIEVYALNGELVYSGTSATIHIPTAGLYIARIAEKSYKVIVQ